MFDGIPREWGEKNLTVLGVNTPPENVEGNFSLERQATPASTNRAVWAYPGSPVIAFNPPNMYFIFPFSDFPLPQNFMVKKPFVWISSLGPCPGLGRNFLEIHLVGGNNSIIPPRAITKLEKNAATNDDAIALSEYIKFRP